MTKQISIQDILLNQIQIPVELFLAYKDLGLNEKEVMLLLQIQRFLQDRVDFPTPDQLAAYVTMDEKECAHLLRALIQKDMLAIKQQEREGEKLSEAYCLTPLWNKLFSSDTQQQEASTDGTIFILFEQEFGRPLSPFEIETINAWLDQDHISPALIKAGLRESVLMGKLNFKYIDRILREWKKKGIHTVEQARNASKQFHSSQTGTNQPTKKRDTSFYYNWLEGED
ncbi:MAG: DnaD domain-containing protein [Bacillota bacterium]|uniref:DnaD domain-containing protein n=1 Tax=Virgibacillus sp. AGTR TaxID=2812055 RepID=UPI0019635BB8|nr:DnaD domain-containing protein [Virgibacillus sp. AGTR]MCC2251258.1 DnaD domain-containing protein [Virgibacillus sp. AGTR]QRZ17045.1 DnaD domain-containing protein [Virgibacillus sp. AGTR]